MTDLEKITFLMTLLKEEKFNMDLAKAHALVTSYKWLIEQLQKEKDGNNN